MAQSHSQCVICTSSVEMPACFLNSVVNEPFDKDWTIIEAITFVCSGHEHLRSFFSFVDKENMEGDKNVPQLCHMCFQCLKDCFTFKKRFFNRCHSGATLGYILKNIHSDNQHSICAVRNFKTQNENENEDDLSDEISITFESTIKIEREEQDKDKSLVDILNTSQFCPNAFFVDSRSQSGVPEEVESSVSSFPDLTLQCSSGDRAPKAQAGSLDIANEGSGLEDNSEMDIGNQTTESNTEAEDRGCVDSEHANFDCGDEEDLNFTDRNPNRGLSQDERVILKLEDSERKRIKPRNKKEPVVVLERLSAEYMTTRSWSATQVGPKKRVKKIKDVPIPPPEYRYSHAEMAEPPHQEQSQGRVSRSKRAAAAAAITAVPVARLNANNGGLVPCSSPDVNRPFRHDEPPQQIHRHADDDDTASVDIAHANFDSSDEGDLNYPDRNRNQWLSQVWRFTDRTTQCWHLNADRGAQPTDLEHIHQEFYHVARDYKMFCRGDAVSGPCGYSTRFKRNMKVHWKYGHDKDSFYRCTRCGHEYDILHSCPHSHELKKGEVGPQYKPYYYCECGQRFKQYEPCRQHGLRAHAGLATARGHAIRMWSSVDPDYWREHAEGTLPYIGNREQFANLPRPPNYIFPDFPKHTTATSCRIDNKKTRISTICRTPRIATSTIHYTLPEDRVEGGGRRNEQEEQRHRSPSAKRQITSKRSKEQDVTTKKLSESKSKQKNKIGATTTKTTTTSCKPTKKRSRKLESSFFFSVA